MTINEHKDIPRAVENHVFLNLNQTLEADYLEGKWGLKIPNNYILEPAVASSITSISNTAFVVDGGYDQLPLAKNFTRLFTAGTDKWITISNENRNMPDAM
jgi:hypothetical protein